MKKQRSLVLRLSLITIGVFLVLFTLFNIITNQYVYDISKKDQQQYVEALSKNSALLIQEKFNETISSLQADRDLLASLYKQNQLKGATILDYKTQALESNEEILGYAVILDSRNFSSVTEADRQYIGEDLMYATYINRVNVDIHADFIEDAAGGEWYLEPKAKGQTYIIEPYDYELNGHTISMVSVAMPIIVDNLFIGVSIADFSLDFLDPIVHENTPETAIQRVISSGGSIVSDSHDANNIMKSITEITTDWDGINETIQRGESWSSYAHSTTFDEDAYSVFLPIQLGTSEDNWIIETLLPKSTILTTFFTILKMSLSASILIGLILAAVTYFSIYRNLKPLKNVQHALQQAAQGALTISVDANKLQNDEIGAVGLAYNAMRSQMHEVVSDVSASSTQVDAQAETMNRVMEEMSQSSAEISTAIDEIAKGALSQAEEIEQSNMHLSLLGDRIDELSLLSKDMMVQVKATGEQAQSGMAEVTKLREHSNNTNDVNAQLEQQMKNLAQKIANIDQVMSSIQGITAQTNLLALNASIEAARLWRTWQRLCSCRR